MLLKPSYKHKVLSCLDVSLRSLARKSVLAHSSIYKNFTDGLCDCRITFLCYSLSKYQENVNQTFLPTADQYNILSKGLLL